MSARGWPALREGDLVQVIAPSGPFDTAGLARGLSLLRTRFDVKTRPDLHERAGFLAGDDVRRAQELIGALSDPHVKGIIAARGGYGATRLLRQIRAEAQASLRTTPKLLVGFSDITALHALWRSAGVGSLHASMAARIANLAEPLQTRWLDALLGRFAPTITGLTPVAPGAAPVSGPLFGGNLSVLYALLGTPHMPDLRGCVLFLEDVNERPYAVDRMLTALRDSGQLDAIAAIVLGRFSDSQPGPDGIEVDAVLAERLGDLGIPVLGGLSAGHIDDNMELPFGKPVQVDPDAGQLRF